MESWIVRYTETLPSGRKKVRLKIVRNCGSHQKAKKRLSRTKVTPRSDFSARLVRVNG
jgi:hypothetical protein